MMLNDFQNFLCKQQRRLFAYALERNADMEKFIENFMNSKFANLHVDADYSPYQFLSMISWIELLKDENIQIEELDSTKKQFSQDFIDWVAIIYRQVQIRSGLSSSEVYKNLSFDLLCQSYEGFHTLDNNLAAEEFVEHVFMNKTKAEKRAL